MKDLEPGVAEKFEEEFEALTDDDDVLEYYRLSSISRVNEIHRDEKEYKISFKDAFHEAMKRRSDFVRKTPGLERKLEKLEGIAKLLGKGEHWTESLISKAEARARRGG